MCAPSPSKLDPFISRWKPTSMHLTVTHTWWWRRATGGRREFFEIPLWCRLSFPEIALRFLEYVRWISMAFTATTHLVSLLNGISIFWQKQSRTLHTLNRACLVEKYFWNTSKKKRKSNQKVAHENLLFSLAIGISLLCSMEKATLFGSRSQKVH